MTFCLRVTVDSHPQLIKTYLLHEDQGRPSSKSFLIGSLTQALPLPLVTLRIISVLRN